MAYIGKIGNAKNVGMNLQEGINAGIGNFFENMSEAQKRKEAIDWEKQKIRDSKLAQEEKNKQDVQIQKDKILIDQGIMTPEMATRYGLTQPQTEAPTFKNGVAGLVDMSQYYTPEKKAKLASEEQNKRIKNLTEQKLVSDIQSSGKDPYGLQKEEAIQDVKNKKLSATEILKVNEGNAIPQTLEKISTVIDSNSGIMGPVEGRARSINPYDTRAQVFNAEVKAAAQQFGRFMEGGVLRKEDEAKYEKMFPSISDTPDAAKGKLQVVAEQLKRKQMSDVGALKQQGKNIHGLEFQPKEMTRLEYLRAKKAGQVK
jgi:hypothetical protein